MMQQTTSPLSVHTRARKVAKVLLSWHGATVNELAQVLGCSQANLSMKLIGARRFRLEELAALADYFGTDPSLFMSSDLEEVLGTPRDAGATREPSSRSPSAGSGSSPRRSGWIADLPNSSFALAA